MFAVIVAKRSTGLVREFEAVAELNLHRLSLYSRYLDYTISVKGQPCSLGTEPQTHGQPVPEACESSYAVDLQAPLLVSQCPGYGVHAKSAGPDLWARETPRATQNTFLFRPKGTSIIVSVPIIISCYFTSVLSIRILHPKPFVVVILSDTDRHQSSQIRVVWAT